MRTLFRVITITLVLAAGGLVFPVFGATLQLGGVVSSVLEVTLTPAPGHLSLNLEIDAADVLVGTVKERANSASGYTVTLESANAVAAGQNTAQFKNISVSTETLDYTMKYGGAPVVLGNGGVVGRSKVTDSNAKTPSGGAARPVQISYRGPAAHGGAAGNGIYQDTLTFTIAAK